MIVFKVLKDEFGLLEERSWRGSNRGFESVMKAGELMSFFTRQLNKK